MNTMAKRLACSLAVAALVAAPAHAKNDKVTHVGATPEDLVVLSGDSFSYDPGGDSFLGPTDFPRALVFTTRLLPDGTEVEDYSVPSDKLLVVTDINWGYLGPQTDHTICLVVRLSTTDPPFGSGSPVHQSCVHTDDDGVGNVSDSLTTGFAVRENEKLYTSGPWDPDNGGPAPDADYLARPDGSAVLVRGYLVDR